ncbi:TetR/AcrR family transcriptional regulator [Streptomyces sp. NPDC006872]|uniref:TetR/AcrR family transcriptional regulator n=1 Tax=Streptomyces sp. NPDC006872 TaxID=3155720 RepID=UPI0034016B3C
MAPSKARGQYAKTAARRAQIVQAARESFAERGYTAASLRDIAERAGISHVGLLHHFRTKDELLTAVLAQRDAEEWQRGQAEVDRLDELAPYIGDMLAEHQKSPELMRLWLELAAGASRPDDPAHEHFVERFERARSHFAMGLRELAAEGELRDGVDPDTASTLFQAVLNGLQLQWLLNPGLDIIAPVEHFVQHFLAPGGSMNHSEGEAPVDR